MNCICSCGSLLCITINIVSLNDNDNEIYHNYYNVGNFDHLADTPTDRVQVKIKDVIDDDIEVDEIHLKDQRLPWDHPSVLIAIKDPERKKRRRFIGSDSSQESTRCYFKIRFCWYRIFLFFILNFDFFEQKIEELLSLFLLHNFISEFHNIFMTDILL